MRCVHDSMKHVLCCVLIVAYDRKFTKTVFGPEKLYIEVEPWVPHIKKGTNSLVHTVGTLPFIEDTKYIVLWKARQINW